MYIYKEEEKHNHATKFKCNWHSFFLLTKVVMFHQEVSSSILGCDIISVKFWEMISPITQHKHVSSLGVCLSGRFSKFSPQIRLNKQQLLPVPTLFPKRFNFSLYFYNIISDHTTKTPLSLLLLLFSSQTVVTLYDIADSYYFRGFHYPS